MTSQGYDFLIVGGGSAGCALAARLSADPSARVLVLEAGRPDYRFDVFIHMPAGLATPIGNRFYDWKYESEPEPFMGGRRVYHARGKILGGSSSINGMIFQRGNPLDYERWASDPGMETWDHAHCLPYFKRMENCLAAINIVLASGRIGKPYCAYGTVVGQGNGQGGREHGQKADQLPGYRRIDDPAARAHVASVWGVAPASLPGPGRSAFELLDSLGDSVRALLVAGSFTSVAGTARGSIARYQPEPLRRPIARHLRHRS